VGHIAVQLAKSHGCKVITTASRDESMELCRKLGADVVINYREQDVTKSVLDQTDGKGCPVVFDTVGGAVFEQSMDCVAINGRLVSIVFTKTDTIFEKLFRKNVSLHLEYMGVPAVYGINREHQRDILTTVAELADAGKLTSHIGKVIGLEDIPEAHRALEAGHSTGKLVVKVR
jgi:NADPH2:quinone reductase